MGDDKLAILLDSVKEGEINKIQLADEYDQKLEVVSADKEADYWDAFLEAVHSGVSEEDSLSFPDQSFQFINYGISFNILEELVRHVLEVKAKRAKPTQKQHEAATLDSRTKDLTQQLVGKLEDVSTPSDTVYHMTQFLDTIYPIFLGVEEQKAVKRGASDDAVRKLKSRMINDVVEMGIPKSVLKGIMNPKFFDLVGSYAYGEIKKKEGGTANIDQESKHNKVELLKEGLSRDKPDKEKRAYKKLLDSAFMRVGECYKAIDERRNASSDFKRRDIDERMQFMGDLFDTLQESITSCLKTVKGKASMTDILSVDSIRSKQEVEKTIDALMDLDIISRGYDKDESGEMKKDGTLKVLYVPARGRPIYTNSFAGMIGEDKKNKKSGVRLKSKHYLIVPLISDKKDFLTGLVNAFLQYKRESVPKKVGQLFKSMQKHYSELINVKKYDDGGKVMPLDEVFAEAYAALIKQAMTGIKSLDAEQADRFSKDYLQRIGADRAFTPHRYRMQLADFREASPQLMQQMIVDAKGVVDGLERTLAVINTHAGNPDKAMHYMKRLNQKLMGDSTYYTKAGNIHDKDPDSNDILKNLACVIKQVDELKSIPVKDASSMSQRLKKFGKEKITDKISSYHNPEIKKNATVLQHAYKEVDLFYIGLLFYNQDDFDNAAFYFKKDMDMHGDNANPYSVYNLGISLMKADNPNGALKYLNEARFSMAKSDKVYAYFKNNVRDLVKKVKEEIKLKQNAEQNKIKKT